MKEHLVTQLKTQISDLERFIEFLQGTNIMCSTVSLITSACVSNFTWHHTLCTVRFVLVLLWCTKHWMRKFYWWFWSCGMLHLSSGEWCQTFWRPSTNCTYIPLHFFCVGCSSGTAWLWRWMHCRPLKHHDPLTHLCTHTLSHPIRLESSAAHLWQHLISLKLYCTG
jgi:hypothetical protein